MTDSDTLQFDLTANTKDRTPIVWLTPRKPSIEIEGPKDNDAWVIVNIESSGYYRVNYDNRNWQLLAKRIEKSDYSDVL